jgi:hypothetical protein
MRVPVVPLFAAGILIALLRPAFADSAADLKAQNVELKKELATMRAEIAQMQKQLDAIETRVSGTPSPRAAASPAASPSPSAASAAGAPPPGVTPAGVPMPESPPGAAVGSAIKSLGPNPMSGATSLPPAYASASPQGRGVIVSGLEGVPKVFIPDIGAVGDFTFRQSDIRKGDARYNPADDKFVPRDTQLILFAPIDPYTNAQISIDRAANGAFDLEEAFLVFNKLPYDLTVRAGQFRPRFGLINQLDTFQLPMVNRPQALTSYIGDDGFVEPGVNLSTYVPNPWDLDIKADLNMVSGVNAASFDHRGGQNYDFAYIGTLAYSRELFRTGSLTTGASFAGGPGPGGASYMEDPFVEVQYAPDQRHILTWSVESLIAQRTGVGDHGVKRGLYTLLDYNFRLRWHTGLLLDMADVPDVARGTEFGISPILTYFVSDNTRLRLQYTHTTASRAVNGPERASNAVYLQATFSLGNLKPLD